MHLVPATPRHPAQAGLGGLSAVQRAPRRDRAMLQIGATVYVWPVPAHRDALRVRRVRLDAPLRPVEPVFAAEDGDPAPRRVQADRLRRLQARAVLFATPATLCSTQDIADVFALREADVRASRPDSARRIGRAWMAPFGDWLGAIGVDLEALAARSDAPREVRVRAPAAPTLRPLGGPGRSR